MEMERRERVLRLLGAEPAEGQEAHLPLGVRPSLLDHPHLLGGEMEPIDVDEEEFHLLFPC